MAKLEKTEKWTFSLTLLVAMTGATLFGGFYGNRLFGAPMQNTDMQKRYREYADLLSAVTTWSAEEITPDKAVYASVDGMLRSLDPHTSFLEPHLALDSVLEIVRGLAELSEGLAERLADLGEPARAEDDQDDGEDEEKLRNSE